MYCTIHVAVRYENKDKADKGGSGPHSIHDTRSSKYHVGKLPTYLPYVQYVYAPKYKQQTSVFAAPIAHAHRPSQPRHLTHTGRAWLSSSTEQRSLRLQLFACGCNLAKSPVSVRIP